mgnify:CR=1 FL=1
MEKTPRDFIFDNLLSMSAYWACTGAIIASLTAYYGFSLALSNVVTGLSGTLPILQLAGGLAFCACVTAHGVYCCRWCFFRCCCRGLPARR